MIIEYLKNYRKLLLKITGVSFLLFGLIYLIIKPNFFVISYSEKTPQKIEKNITSKITIATVLDKTAYDKKLEELANKPTPPPVTIVEKETKVDPDISSGKNTKTKSGKVKSKNIKPKKVKPAPVVDNLWPVKTVYPNTGAILPFNRIVAYYGNLYSKKMGVLGEYPEKEMLDKLRQEVKVWEKVDPETPVIPAIDYIAVTAQGSPGADGMYRFRMPDTQIDLAVELAKKVDGIVILEIQPGLSSILKEVKYFEKYLKTSTVHLALDPEFNMKNKVKPGKVIGTIDATEINQVAEYLANLVKENNLTPKVLIIHRFTNKMVTNYKLIKPLPEVQIVMDMDGWGFPAKKINTHRQVIYKEPVQFTGFKLFYKHDNKKPNSRIMTPVEVLKLKPQPSFIQYQ